MQRVVRRSRRACRPDRHAPGRAEHRDRDHRHGQGRGLGAARAAACGPDRRTLGRAGTLARRACPKPPGSSRPPDWLAEILSPSTARFDRAETLPLYARWGVAQVWLVDPDLRTLEACATEGGRWVLLATPKDDETLRQPPFDTVGSPLSSLWT
jgi:hypothetical protein